jgi:hypothetical protein
MRLDRHDSGRVSLHDFTVLFDTYTGKYVPNGKQMENLLNYQEGKTKSFDNCKFFQLNSKIGMSFLNSLAKKPQVNATKIHYVSTTSGAKHKSLVGATPLVGGLPHEKKYGPGLEFESDEKKSSVLFDIVLQTNKSNLSNLLPNPMVKPPISRTKKLAKTAAPCSRAKKRKTILNQNQSIFEIMQTWLVMIKLDRQLQNDLQDLTLRPDYSVIDLFRCN